MKTVILLLLLMSVAGFGAVSAQEQTALTEAAKTEKFCPVCGPEEKMEELTFFYKHEGKKYGFCSMDCLKAFKKDPKIFLGEGQDK